MIKMVEALGILLAVATTFFIARPFFKTKQVELNFNSTNKVDELVARKTELYSAIKDIEFDREMGKLSDDDYVGLRDSYKAEAAQVIQQIEQIKNGKKRKKNKGAKASSQEKFCHECGDKIAADDKFCMNCGTKQHSS